MKKMPFFVAFLFLIGGTTPLFAQGENAVGQRTFSFEDKTRNRKLVTEVWYPTDSKTSIDENSPFVRIPTARDGAVLKGTFPVILFSHGTGGGRLTVEWLCAGLASHGFVVVAVDHFGNTFDNPIPMEFVKFWERPQDLTFVLNLLITSPDIAPAMDSKRIGVAGFSLGGYTAIALAGGKMDYDALQNYFMTESGKKEAEIPEMPGLSSLLGNADLKEAFKNAPTLKDERIKSVFLMSPAIGQAFPGVQNLKDVTVPVYIVAASKDHVAPLKTNAAHYAILIKTSEYTTVGTEAGHYVFLNEANTMLKTQAPVFFQDPPDTDRNSIHAQTLRLALEHFTRTLK